MYGHERLLRWTGIGKTYRYDDDVVQRSAQVNLQGRPAGLAGLFAFVNMRGVCEHAGRLWACGAFVGMRASAG